MVKLEELNDASTAEEEEEVTTSDDVSLTPSAVFDQIMGPTVTYPTHHHEMTHCRTNTPDCSGCPERRDDGIDGYSCTCCGLTFHKECAESPLEINLLSHPRHPLTLLVCGPPDYADERCRLCGVKLKLLVYHCSICDFSVDPCCAREPPELVVNHLKGHDHELTLMPRLVWFTCNACGLDGDRSPYVCPQCDFMVHGDCIWLPRVINIIRHKHRISRRYFIGSGNWVCGVCRQKVDGRYGGYSCSVCPNYVVHSRCAIRRDVWDGRELEDEPEENDDTEDFKPFKVIEDNVINHFSHEEHNLKLNDDNNWIILRCKACIRPIYSDPFYKCMHCDDFILHETCANLPRKQRHVLHNHPLILHPRDNKGVFLCSACGRISSGFMYKCCNVQLDVICGSVSEPFVYAIHPHPLFLTCLDSKFCGACGREGSSVLSCIDCEFALDFKCATLPSTLNYKFDRHSLSLCHEEDIENDQYWCEICEGKLDPRTIHYTCHECDPTFHIECVFGDFNYVMPNKVFKLFFDEFKVDVNGINRPRCYMCTYRCKAPFFAVSKEFPDRFVCSLSCLRMFPKHPKLMSISPSYRKMLIQ